MFYVLQIYIIINKTDVKIVKNGLVRVQYLLHIYCVYCILTVCCRNFALVSNWGVYHFRPAP